MERSLLPYLLAASCLIAGCKKDDADPNDTQPPSVPSRSFSDVHFSNTNAFFSTSSGMQQPVDSTAAQAMADQIDLSFIFAFSYDEPGFMAPRTRSEHWYWDDYYAPWLSVADSTTIYSTSITEAQFTSARNNSARIGAYFADSLVVQLAPHAIFPTGTCIGGRATSNPGSVTIDQGDVFGFKNNVTGKRGLVFIRHDQNQGWPIPFLAGTTTKVDIVREP